MLKFSFGVAIGVCLTYGAMILSIPYLVEDTLKSLKKRS